jgi:hypothetical protein
MRQKRPFIAMGIAAALLLIVPVATALGSSKPPGPPARQLAFATALGDAFTYQGRLTDNAAPAAGSYDIRFILYDAESGGAQVGVITETKENVNVVNGLFTVDLAFGAGAFNGDARWLEIAVRPGTSTGTFTVLAPRQPVTPTPYALYTKVAGSANSLKLPFTGSNDTTGAVLNITASTAAATAAKLKGTTALELDGALKVSGTTPTAFVTAIAQADTNTCDVGDGTDNGFIVDNALTNGDPTAILIVTPRGVSTLVGSISVFYDPDGATSPGICATTGTPAAAGRWIIQHSGGTQLTGLAFNVLVIKPTPPPTQAAGQDAGR